VKTVITDLPAEAAEYIRRGGIVAFPTETVYGLGADVFNESAIEKIFKAKQRPPDNPLIVHISDRRQITSVATEVTSSAEKLIARFFPGPITVVLKKRSEVPLIATAGLETVGIRMPEDPTAHAFLLACGTPVVAPSANISGRPSPTVWQSVHEDLDGRIDCILKGDPTRIGLESTVVDCTGETPILLRPGAIAIDHLREVVPDIAVAAIGPGAARSPGMRHKHYSPHAIVKIITPKDAIERPGRSGFIGLNDRTESVAIKKLCSSLEEYAQAIFEFFRECDRRNVDTIFCEAVPAEGIGVALMDRLRRAGEC
jgi:L-threonylcarbamoyladenylate synthase